MAVMVLELKEHTPSQRGGWRWPVYMMVHHQPSNHRIPASKILRSVSWRAAESAIESAIESATKHPAAVGLDGWTM